MLPGIHVHLHFAEIFSIITFEGVVHSSFVSSYDHQYLKGHQHRYLRLSASIVNYHLLMNTTFFRRALLTSESSPSRWCCWSNWSLNKSSSSPNKLGSNYTYQYLLAQHIQEGVLRTSGITPGITPNPSSVSLSILLIFLGPTNVSASLSGTLKMSLIIESGFIIFFPGRSLICPWYDFRMVFFIPVVGSKRITELANGVNEYNDTKSCDAEGLDGRCSIYISASCHGI